jgi:hypothetical protein
MASDGTLQRGGQYLRQALLPGCVIVTKKSTCLVNAKVLDPPGDVGPVRVKPLCGRGLTRRGVPVSATLTVCS